MPTWEPTSRFKRDLAKLSPESRIRFKSAVETFVEDLRRQQTDPGWNLRPALRVKPVEGTEDTWEMTWGADGRATFRYGDPLSPGEVHVIWLRVGTHAIFEK